MGTTEPTRTALNCSDAALTNVFETLKLVLGTTEPTRALFNMGFMSSAPETLELVLRAAEPAHAAGDHGGTRILNALKALELVSRATEPANALLDVVILGRNAQTLKLVLGAAEPTRAVLNHRHRGSPLANHLHAFTAACSGKPACALVDRHDMPRFMVSRVGLIATRVVASVTHTRLLHTNARLLHTNARLPHADLWLNLPTLRASSASLTPLLSTFTASLSARVVLSMPAGVSLSECF